MLPRRSMVSIIIRVASNLRRCCIETASLLRIDANRWRTLDTRAELNSIPGCLHAGRLPASVSNYLTISLRPYEFVFQTRESISLLWICSSGERRKSRICDNEIGNLISESLCYYRYWIVGSLKCASIIGARGSRVDFIITRNWREALRQWYLINRVTTTSFRNVRENLTTGINAPKRVHTLRKRLLSVQH